MRVEMWLDGRMLDRLGGIRSLQIVFALITLVMLPSFVAAGLVTAGADLAMLYTVSYLAGPERVPDYAALNSTISGFRGLLGPFIGSVLVDRVALLGSICDERRFDVGRSRSAGFHLKIPGIRFGEAMNLRHCDLTIFHGTHIFDTTRDQLSALDVVVIGERQMLNMVVHAVTQVIADSHRDPLGNVSVR